MSFDMFMTLEIGLVLLMYWVWTHPVTPKCSECGANDPMGMGPLGVWWHRAGCSYAGPFASDDDDE